MYPKTTKNAKGRTRTQLFAMVLFSPFRAQISSHLLVGVGHCLCLFVLVVALVVALNMSAVPCLDVYRTTVCADRQLATCHMLPKGMCLGLFAGVLQALISWPCCSLCTAK